VPELILHADSTTLKLENQQNGWHGVCINHEWNGDEVFDPIWALARRYGHIQQQMGDSWDTLLSAVFSKGIWSDVTDNNIQHALKFAAAQLNYPVSCGIPIERINSHSLWIGGANALAMAGYSD
jgi:hypothetical protein